MTAVTKQANSPISHLTPEDIEAIGRELDEIRREVMESRGESDAAYIRRVIKAQRYLEIGSRAVLLVSIFPPAWVLGTAGLSVAKILDNMEIGHNVLHGQWDWMRDSKIHSTVWDWDSATPVDLWQRSHNETHHTYTNIVGQDNDLGYGIMRVDEDQAWEPRHLAQPIVNFFNMLFFQYGIAAYDLNVGQLKGVPMKDRSPQWHDDAKRTMAKVKRQALKEYVIMPVLSGPSFLTTLAANFTADVVRNVWSHAIIMCGHFPEGVETFETESIDPNDSRGEGYLRQMLGSANISGSPLLHLMSGNLSHQIEHHIWPDLPSNRYAQVAPRVQNLFERYALDYNSRPFIPQVASAWHRIVRLSLPNNWLRRTTVRNLPKQLRLLATMATTDPATRAALQKELDA